MNAPLSELKSAHQELMTRYVTMLDETRHARWLISRKHGRSRLLILRSLVHLFVEGHIRKKLKELSEGYLTLRVQAPADAIDHRDWAKECGEVCDKMSGTLATWASIEGAFKLLWPIAVGGFTAWLGVKDIWEVVRKLDANAYFLAYGILLFPAIYLLLFISDAFAYKREMFIPGFDVDEQPYDPQLTAPESNVYLLEDRLFNLLRRRKSREKPWDIYFAAIGSFIFGSVPLWSLLGGEKPSWFLWLSGGFFWAIGILGLFRRKKRLWR